jgi:hypothetical protein
VPTPPEIWFFRTSQLANTFRLAFNRVARAVILELLKSEIALSDLSCGNWKHRVALP